MTFRIATYRRYLRYATAGCDLSTADENIFRSQDNSPFMGHFTRYDLLCVYRTV